jgi:hypothetical protein
VTFLPASFRDPDARVLEGDGTRVLRALSARAAGEREAVERSGLLAELVAAGLLVESAPASDVAPPAGFAAVVASRRLAFATYPYEWSFGMLRDAALVTLDVLAKALERGATLKDASAYNVLFDGARPLFIDVASLMPHEDGTPWLGYGQFCDHFLAPLMLEAYRGVPFQPFLRGSLEGLSIGAQLSPLLGGRDWLRPGVLTHVKLRALLDRRTQDLATEARREVRRVSLPRQAVLATVRRLRALVARLASRAPSVWARYDETSSYDEALTARKEAFVAAAAERAPGTALAWDVGANTGRYARVLARRFDLVVAMDGDAGAVDRLYTALRGTPEARRLLPVVVDVMNPSPAQGWRGTERSTLAARGVPGLALYLALVHHLCLGRGVPLAGFLDLVQETSPLSVVEFVTREDAMSQRLLATKPEHHGDYDLETFRALARARGSIVTEEQLSPTRSLFLLDLRPVRTAASGGAP